jgi:hypothetical protein
MDLDPYIVTDSTLFLNQIPDFIRAEGLLQLPFQLMQGQSMKKNTGFFYNNIRLSVASGDQKNILQDKNLQKSYRIGFSYSVRPKVDVVISYQKLNKIGSKSPFLLSMGFSYNLFRRISKSHLNVVFNFSELKRHEDMYIKSFYVGGLYKSFGSKMDYVLNFGINRTHGKLFPNQHPDVRKSKIENDFIYQIGFTFHLSRLIHLQASYIKANYSLYMWGVLLTSQ